MGKQYISQFSYVSNAREGACPGLRDAFSRALVLRDAFYRPAWRKRNLRLVKLWMFPSFCHKEPGGGAHL